MSPRLKTIDKKTRFYEDYDNILSDYACYNRI